MRSAAAGSASLSNKHASQGTPFAPTRQGSLSLNDDERQPPLTPVNFRDPVYERVQALAMLREEDAARDVEGGWKD